MLSSRYQPKDSITLSMRQRMYQLMQSHYDHMTSECFERDLSTKDGVIFLYDDQDCIQGFSTMVQPAASAGITLTATWLIGQFHGVIMPQTPIGS